MKSSLTCLCLLYCCILSLVRALPIESPQSEDDGVDSEHLKPSFDDERPPVVEEEDPVEIDGNSNPEETAGHEIELVPVLHPDDNDGRSSDGNRRRRQTDAISDSDSDEEDDDDDDVEDPIPTYPEDYVEDPEEVPPEPFNQEAKEKMTRAVRSADEESEDTVIIEACEDYESTCGEDTTRGADPVCKALKEKCDSSESTGEFVDTFFCLDGNCDQEDKQEDKDK